MTTKSSIELIQEAAERIRNDPVKLKEFMRKVMGPPRRTLEGEEYKHMMLVLSLKTPISSSNNQRSWTDEYEHDGRRYDVTYGITDEPIIDEIGD